MPSQLGQNLFLSNALKYGFSLYGVPKTGQTTKRRTGDDGDLEKGYPETGARFTDNGDGTITDNATGLMWVKDPSQLGGVWGTPGSPAADSWSDAIDNCLALNCAGHQDWRLPNAKELITLIDYERLAPAIDATFFPNTQSNHYWSSSGYSDDENYEWAVDFTIGHVEDKLRPTTQYVRPVRLGVPA